MYKIVLLIGGFLIAVASAQDVRDKVAPPATEARLPNSIDPDASIYGIPYGITEDEFISRFGKATGYVRITPNERDCVSQLLRHLDPLRCGKCELHGIGESCVDVAES